MLGLRLVKKSVNQDDPTVYHLFYADEKGTPGSDITFFEYPGARPGRAGAGMVHTVVWRVGSEEALDFWARAGVGERSPFADPDGLAARPRRRARAGRAARRRPSRDPARARAAGLRGRARVRARAGRDAAFLEALGFDATAGTRGDTRGGWIDYEQAPDAPGVPGAGTVHHVAWASTMEEHEAWRERVEEAGGRPTPIIDRFWFRSIYFREPNGVLFEIATLGPGFDVDEDPAHLGETLILPPAFEHLRAQVEPRADAAADPANGDCTARSCRRPRSRRP